MSLVAPRATTSSSGLGETGALFLALSVLLTGFGVLMIYSASSIMALTSEACGYNPAFYAIRQGAFALVGAVLAVILWHSDYHLWSQKLMIPLWVVTVVALCAVFTSAAGQDAYGATRWIGIGSIHLQPSEFAKAVLLLCAAELFRQYFEEGSLTIEQLAMRAAVFIVGPLLLILKQPDKGSVLIIGLTVMAMLFLAGLPLKITAGLVAAGVGTILLLALKDEYSRARIAMMSNPWIDPYGDGYQLIQGYYAFGSGGLLGVGLGMSRQKYSYLPMAHNDFILAVIGEELGFVGLVVLLLCFLALIWLGYKIAREAPDLSGRLIAAGCVTMIGLQLMVNACGVLGIIPLSGKPVPFISYGGSSIMSTLILVGLTLSVARSSQSSAVRARSEFSVLEGTSSSGFRVIQGGAGRTPDDLRSSQDLIAHAGGRVSYNANGTRRIDLGRGPSDRLRGR